MLRLDLPYPPSVNTYWRNWRGRMVISKAGRAYQDAVLKALRGRTYGIINKPVSILILVNPPDRRKRDIDNIQKALFDALTKARVWKDDSQIERLYVDRYKYPVVKGGFVTVFVEVL